MRDRATETYTIYIISCFYQTRSFLRSLVWFVVVSTRTRHGSPSPLWTFCLKLYGCSSQQYRESLVIDRLRTIRSELVEDPLEMTSVLCLSDVVACGAVDHQNCPCMILSTHCCIIISWSSYKIHREDCYYYGKYVIITAFTEMTYSAMHQQTILNSRART